MKNCLILHGTSNNSQDNWFQWLSSNLQQGGYKTWVPDLPDADVPNPVTYLQFIKDNNWAFDQNSVMVGHSSGAVAILYILQNLQADTTIDTAVLVGAFKDNLGRDELSRLFNTPFDFEIIKSRARRIVLIHSDNDPYCPLEHAQYLANQLEAELILMPGEAHFSISTAGEEYNEFPKLLEILA